MSYEKVNVNSIEFLMPYSIIHVEDDHVTHSRQIFPSDSILFNNYDDEQKIIIIIALFFVYILMMRLSSLNLEPNFVYKRKCTSHDTFG